MPADGVDCGPVSIANRMAGGRFLTSTGDRVLAENVYECLFLLDSNHYARDPAATAQLVDRLIEEAGGKVLVSRLWNEQRLAYPVEGHRKGTYWLAYFQMDGDGVTPLNRACRIHDTVLRQMVLKVDPRLVETLVAHAKGEAVAGSDEEEASEDAVAVPAADASATDADAATAAATGAEAAAGAESSSS